MWKPQTRFYLFFGRAAAHCSFYQTDGSIFSSTFGDLGAECGSRTKVCFHGDEGILLITLKLTFGATYPPNAL